MKETDLVKLRREQLTWFMKIIPSFRLMIRFKTMKTSLTSITRVDSSLWRIWYRSLIFCDQTVLVRNIKMRVRSWQSLRLCFGLQHITKLQNFLTTLKSTTPTNNRFSLPYFLQTLIKIVNLNYLISHHIDTVCVKIIL